MNPNIFIDNYLIIHSCINVLYKCSLDQGLVELYAHCNQPAFSLRACDLGLLRWKNEHTSRLLQFLVNGKKYFCAHNCMDYKKQRTCNVIPTLLETTSNDVSDDALVHFK